MIHAASRITTRLPSADEEERRNKNRNACPAGKRPCLRYPVANAQCLSRRGIGRFQNRVIAMLALRYLRTDEGPHRVALRKDVFPNIGEERLTKPVDLDHDDRAGLFDGLRHPFENLD